MLFEQSDALMNQSTGQVPPETDQDNIDRLTSLAELYYNANRDMLKELEEWAFTLIGPEVIDSPKMVKKPEEKGFYTAIAERYEKKFAERLDSERLQETESLDEGLELLLDEMIDIHRGERPVLAAIESEALSNLTPYDQVAESVSVEDLMESISSIIWNANAILFP